MVKYCELLIRTEQKANQPEEKEEVKQETGNNVNEADLKKEKLSIMAPKKELERFPVNKKKPQPAKKTNKPVENTKRMLNLPLEILNAFENTKVRAPIFQDEVEASLNLAKEKFTYFSALGI